MKMIVLIFTYLYLLIAGAPDARAGNPAGDAALGHLVPDTCVVDMGDIPGDRVAERVLGFSNSGSGELQILSVFTDCGCTVAEYSSGPVAPGGRGEIGIRFNPRGRRAGAFRKVLRLRSDADNPRVTVIVRGSVTECSE